MGFLHGFSIAMGANALLFVFSFATNKLLYQFLSHEDNGLYFLVSQFALLISVLFGEWLRLTTINLAGESRSRTPILAANILVYTSLIGGILLLMAAVLPDLFDRMLPAAYVAPAVLVGIGFILRDGFQSLLLVNNRIGHYGFTTILWAGLSFLLSGIVLLLLHRGLTAVLIVLIISTFITAAWSIGSVVVSIGSPSRPSLTLFAHSARLGFRAAIAVIGMTLMIRVHPFAVSAFGGLALTGLFSVSFRIFQLFQRVSDVTGSILYAQVAQHDEQRGFALTARVNRNLLLFSTLFALGAVALGKPLIIIIADASYQAAYVPLLCMLPGIVAINAGSVLNSSYWGRGYPVSIILAPYAAAAVGLALDTVLIPHFGDGGASVAFSITSLLWYAYLVAVFRRDASLPLREVLLPQQADFETLVEHTLARIRRRP